MRPILLAGLPRSGTTWAGQILREATGQRLVHEPFNWRIHPKRKPFHMRYLPAGADDPGFAAIWRQVISGRVPGLGWLYRRRPPVIKDVHTCLALEYITELIDPALVILMRHPCGVAQSWQSRKLEAGTRIQLLLDQPALLADHLAPYEQHLRDAADWFEQIGAYWGATYYVIQRQQQQYPGWQIVTHEALCADPATAFRSLVERMGIAMRESTREFIERHNRPQQAHEGAHSIARQTEQEPHKWRDRLSTEEVSAVLRGAAPFGVFERFFPAG